MRTLKKYDRYEKFVLYLQNCYLKFQILSPPKVGMWRDSLAKSNQSLDTKSFEVGKKTTRKTASRDA